MGLTAHPLYRTVKLIAKTDAFRNWCGIDTTQTEDEQYADAKGRCHLHQAPLNATRPFALVEWEERSRERYGTAYLHNASVRVGFVNDFAEETADNIENHDESVQGIINDIEGITGTGDLVEFDTISWDGWDIVPVDEKTNVIFNFWIFQGPQWGRSDY